MNCRHCKKLLKISFLNLGYSPPSNAYLSTEDLKKPELTYPLRLFVCDNCWLVQTEDYADAESLFSPEYAYFSSVSTSWLAHAKNYTGMITERLGLNAKSFVMEIAANDGYLLKNFVIANIPCLGIEPTASTAAAAETQGIPILREFFGNALAMKLKSEGKQADLIIGNNVYAHVPDINDFTAGLKTVLKPEGTITLEFPHLMQLLEYCQFDTVYHEHYSYLSLHTVNRIFSEAGLRIWDVEELPTHGGSLRIYGCHTENNRANTTSVQSILEEEKSCGMQKLGTYQSFQKRADKIKNDLLLYLIEKNTQGKRIAAYGAAAKGNTLLNYAGIKPDLISCVYDAAFSKQGKYLPGSHIPIFPPEMLKEQKPDILLIVPWNIKDEIMTRHSYVSDWGCKFVLAGPQFQIFP